MSKLERAVAAVEAQLSALSGQMTRLKPGDLARYLGRDIAAGWRLNVTFPDAERRVDILVPQSFPFGLPRVALVDRPDFFEWPHVERDGVLCLQAGTIDHSDPAKVALNLLISAVSLVEEILAGSRDADFTDEFLTYWSYSTEHKGVPVYSLLDISPPSRMVRLWKGRRFSLVAAADAVIKAWLDNRYATAVARKTETAGLIWIGDPLRPSEFPRVGADIRRLAFDGDAEAAVVELAARGVHDATIFLAADTERGPAIVGTFVPKPDEAGSNALTRGFRPNRMPADILLDRFFGGNRVKRFSVERADAAWIHGRGSDPRFTHLRQRAVVIIGCGSIGAAVAYALAQAGVGRLVLIDPDFLTWANVGRHPLGAEYVGQRKATALATKLMKDFPHLDAVPHVASIERILVDKPELVEDVHLAVLATGEWSAESMFDAYRQTEGLTFPCVFGWTEAHACAGHAVAIIYGDQPFPAGFDRTGLPHLRVAEWPNPTTQREPACGGVYQPYGPVELGFTVNMISELAMDCMLGAVKTSQLRVWACRKPLLEQTGGRWTQAWRKIVGDQSQGGLIVERPWGPTVVGSIKRDEAA